MKKKGDRHGDVRSGLHLATSGQLCDLGQVFFLIWLSLFLALAEYRDHPNTVPNTENTELSL